MTDKWSAPLRVEPARTGDVGRCAYMGCQSDGAVVLHAASGEVTVRVPLCKYHESFCSAVEAALSVDSTGRVSVEVPCAGYPVERVDHSTPPTEWFDDPRPPLTPISDPLSGTLAPWPPECPK